MKDQHLESSVFIQQDQTTLFSCKTSPNDVVKQIVCYEGVFELFLIVESDLLLESDNRHLLAFEFKKLSLDRLLIEFKGMFF